MPQIITDENDAMDILKRRSAYNVDPTLDEANDLQPILESCQRAVIWEASTVYALGSVVQPTAANRNGHRFVLVRFDGTGVSSGTTEPSWPSSDNGIVTDGNLTWQEAGPDYLNLWDLNQACYEAWQMKIDKVSCQYDFSANGSSDSMSQRIATFERQRDRYRQAVIA